MWDSFARPYAVKAWLSMPSRNDSFPLPHAGKDSSSTASRNDSLKWDVNMSVMNTKGVEASNNAAALTSA